ncbi:MAG: BON domain-containing protein [Persicimonas sp.]
MNRQPLLQKRRRRRRRRMKLVRVTLVVVALAGIAAGAWAWHSQDQRRKLTGAGSHEVVSPIGAVRLIGQMPSTQTAERESDDSDNRPARVSDSRIHLQVDRKLQEMNLSRERVDVRIDNGVVTMEGVVDDRTVRDAYEITVRTVDGVREVHNHIELADDE